MLAPPDAAFVDAYQSPCCEHFAVWSCSSHRAAPTIPVQCHFILSASVQCHFILRPLWSSGAPPISFNALQMPFVEIMIASHCLKSKQWSQRILIQNGCGLVFGNVTSIYIYIYIRTYSWCDELLMPCSFRKLVRSNRVGNHRNTAGL